MTKIWKVMRRDVAHAMSSLMSIIVVIGLVVIPSLFTWFNVIASWDPFNNTKGLTVAIANTDVGYQSDLVPLRINIGEQVLSSRRANDDFNWVVTSKSRAIDGTKSGEYYAAIVLPKHFSKDMLNFYASDASRTDITYYTNEKKNALAPKITGQGADRVSASINQVFTKTLSEVGINLLSSLSENLNSGDTQALFARLEARSGATASQLRAAADTATTFTRLIDSGQSLASSSAKLIQSTGESVQDAKGAIGSGVKAAGSAKSTIDSATNDISAALGESAKGYTALANSIDAAFNAADEHTASQVKLLNALADRVQTQIDSYNKIRTTLNDDVAPHLPSGALDNVNKAIDRAISSQEAVQSEITQAARQLQTNNASAQSTHKELTRIISGAKKDVEALRAEFNGDLKHRLDKLSTTLKAALAAASDVGQDIDQSVNGLTGGATSLNAQLGRAKTLTTSLASSLRDAAHTFSRLEKALKQASTAGDFSALQDILGTNPASVAASLAAPVGLHRIAVFPVANFGSAMAPLYTTLALFVGALLIAVSIQTNVADGSIPGADNLKPHQKYLGRYGVFALIGFGQSTLVCLGNLVFVHVQAVHPMLFLLNGWITSLIFTLIVYTAVVAFGNAGKALSVLLLVVQISTSGGAYPLPLLPEWFQQISMFLPATYAVRGFRAAIAGIYSGDYWIALGTLVLFSLPVLLLGLVLRKPLVSFNHKLSTALASTKLM